MTYKKVEEFEPQLQSLAEIAKAFSHPARLAILKHLAKSKTCISGDISNDMPLCRTTVSQHLQELKKIGFIQGQIKGVQVKYCLNTKEINQCKAAFENFFKVITATKHIHCK